MGATASRRRGLGLVDLGVGDVLGLVGGKRDGAASTPRLAV